MTRFIIPLSCLAMTLPAASVSLADSARATAPFTLSTTIASTDPNQYGLTDEQLDGMRRELDAAAEASCGGEATRLSESLTSKHLAPWNAFSRYTLAIRYECRAAD